MSDSSQPYGLQPARLLCPWNSPGKNTGASCHFLLQGIFPAQGLTLPLLSALRFLTTEPPGKPCSSVLAELRDQKASKLQRLQFRQNTGGCGQAPVIDKNSVSGLPEWSCCVETGREATTSIHAAALKVSWNYRNQCTLSLNLFTNNSFIKI